MQSLQQAPQRDPRVVPHPPRLHWGVVLALSVLTLGLFGAVWLVVQANWVRQISGDPQPRRWAVVNLCTLSALFVLGVALSGYPVAAELKSDTLSRLILNLIKIVPYLIAIVQLRSALEEEPIDLTLVGAMAFFFGPVYFQFFLRDYALPSAVDVFGPIPPAPAYVPATAPEEPR